MAVIDIGEIVLHMRGLLGGVAEDAIHVVLAHQAEGFMDEIRGPYPGAGPTPFDTGRLLASGQIDVTEVSVVFENDASELGKESYASYAHHSGDAVGQYDDDSERLFQKYFGEDAAIALGEVTAGLLDVG